MSTGFETMPGNEPIPVLESEQIKIKGDVAEESTEERAKRLIKAEGQMAMRDALGEDVASFEEDKEAEKARKAKSGSEMVN